MNTHTHTHPPSPTHQKKNEGKRNKNLIFIKIHVSFIQGTIKMGENSKLYLSEAEPWFHSTHFTITSAASQSSYFIEECENETFKNAEPNECQMNQQNTTSGRSKKKGHLQITE